MNRQVGSRPAPCGRPFVARQAGNGRAGAVPPQPGARAAAWSTQIPRRPRRSFVGDYSRFTT
eukprot:7233922-Prymnesium_polylepis.1